MSSAPVPFESLDVQQFAQRLIDQPDSLQLIDVREPEELEMASLPGFVNLPLSQFAQWSESISRQFDPQQETVVMCHHGMRSAQMCAWLAQQGFTRLHNLTGGIDAFAQLVDPTVPRY